MNDLELLIEDYQRRLKTNLAEMAKGGNDLTLNRLGTKASCYRTFISELTKIKEAKNKFNCLEENMIKYSAKEKP